MMPSFVKRLLLQKAHKLLRHSSLRQIANLSGIAEKYGSNIATTNPTIMTLNLNIKNLGYEIARNLQPNLHRINTSDEPRFYGLVSKATTQDDIESGWFTYWCSEIKAAPIYHRKLWEFAFVLQALYDNNLLRPNVAGIGFGCGREPLASYFASKEMSVIVSDLEPKKVSGMGWAETGQHTTCKDLALYPEIVSKNTFDKKVSHRYIDMNSIPDMDTRFDFCWSVCAMEHLGSIKQGLDFVEASLKLLKPGGIAIHTTEYNYSSAETIEYGPTVLFTKHHFTHLADILLKQGHQLLGPDFRIGSGFLDRFVDVPPYFVGEGGLSSAQWSEANQLAHLKLLIGDFRCTCFGIIVKKAG